ncbi:hypothetical protein PIB30_094771, partial [Stylosanthes scabra]|nr:hypothetical protein [Stylosanthes scabra]
MNTFAKSLARTGPNCEITKPPLLSIKRANGPNSISFFIFRRKKEKKEERVVNVCKEEGWWIYYSPTPSGSHNFRSRALIDAPFAPTRSLFRPLRFYTTWK